MRQACNHAELVAGENFRANAGACQRVIALLCVE
jgi:hypothetical protein